MSQNSDKLANTEVTFDQNELLKQAGIGLDDIEIPQDEVSPVADELSDLGKKVLFWVTINSSVI